MHTISWKWKHLPFMFLNAGVLLIIQTDTLQQDLWSTEMFPRQKSTNSVITQILSLKTATWSKLQLGILIPFILILASDNTAFLFPLSEGASLCWGMYFCKPLFQNYWDQQTHYRLIFSILHVRNPKTDGIIDSILHPSVLISERNTEDFCM